MDFKKIKKIKKAKPSKHKRNGWRQNQGREKQTTPGVETGKRADVWGEGEVGGWAVKLH